MSLIPLNVRYFLLKYKIFEYIFLRTINEDIKLYFLTDLNILREYYLYPFFQSYINKRHSYDKNSAFYIIVKNIMDIDINIEYLKEHYVHMTVKEKEIINIGINYLEEYYGVSIPNTVAPILNKDFNKIIKHYNKRFLVDFKILSSGSHKIKKIKYYLINHITYYYNKLLLEELEYIKLNSKEEIKDDTDVINNICHNTIYNKLHDKNTKKIIFLMEENKLGGAEKQFHILYHNVRKVFLNRGYSTEIIYSKDLSLNFNIFIQINIQMEHIKTLRLIKNKTLKKGVFNSVMYLSYYRPYLVVTSMHYCGMSSLVADRIIGQKTYHYVRIGSNPPKDNTNKINYLSKSVLIKNIYNISKSNMSVIVNCDYLKKIYHDFLPNNRVITIYNVIPNLYPNIKSSNNFLDNGRAINLGFVGRNTPTKNIISLVEMFAKLNQQLNVPMHLFIYSDYLINTSIQSMVTQLKLNSYVHLIENETNKNEIYNSFDVYVSLSIEEGLSNSIMEALSYSIPCISLDVGGSKEIIKHGLTGYIAENNQEIFNFLCMLLRNKKLVLEMKENLGYPSLEKFSDNRMICSIKEEKRNQNIILPLGNIER